MADEGPTDEAPRLFLSYAWTSPEHEAWVMELARRLRGDGVDVIFDKWGLGPGQDGHVFMERMVNDPTVSRVLMVCDQAYVDKANGRRGGVGTEAQIISPQLYRDNSADQTKFAAACLVRDADDQPLVPIFYKGRIHFDFTRHAGFDTAYTQVLRWAHGQPQHVPPPLGRRPALSEPDLTAPTPTAASVSRQALDKAEAFRQLRLVDIKARRTPAPISSGAVTVLHMIPLPMIETDESVDIVTLVNRGTEIPVPRGGQGGQVSIDFEGVCNTLGDGGYGHLARNGVYEGFHVFSQHGGQAYVASIAFANMVVATVRRGLRLQTHYGFPFPIAVLLSFDGVAGVTMRLRTEWGSGWYDTRALDRAELSFPRVILDRPDANVPAVLRPLLNAVWNAFGQAGCDVYNGQGDWIGTG